MLLKITDTVIEDRLKSPLTVAQAASVLGLSNHTVRAWISKRMLAHARLGRAIRILPAEIQRLLESSAVPVMESLHREERMPDSSPEPIRNQEPCK